MFDRCSLQDVFTSGYEAYAQGRDLHLREREAARCISQCFTPALGAHLQSCPQGDYSHVQYHACRHRSCPRCARDAHQAWLQAQLQRLLPCPHAHVIFTLPHRLLPLWEFNRAWFIGVLFDCARQALLQLMRDPARLGATPGILMSLHTWGRNLSHHPHLHCLVSAGGIDEQGLWRASRGKWILPWLPLMQLYRGKLLHALSSALQLGQLQLPPWTTAQQWQQQLGPLHRLDWSVRVCPVYPHGRGVVLYLARYAKGGPLNAKLLQTDGHDVRMRYLDHRSRKRRWLRLPTPEFIARVLLHAPPRSVHTTRHAGLYSTPWRAQHALAAAALGAPLRQAAPSSCAQPPSQDSPSTQAKRCPRCGGPLLRQLLLRPLLRRSWHERSRGISISSPTIGPAATGPPLRNPQSPRTAPARASAATQRCPTRRSS